MCECAGPKTNFMFFWTAITGLFWLIYVFMRVSPYGRTCPFSEGAANFDADKYTGRWYEFGRSDSVPKEWEVCSCQHTTYVKRENNFIDVLNVEYCIEEDQFSNAYEGWETDGNVGSAQCSKWRNGLCQVKFFIMAPWANYEVISVDFNEYSIVYSCTYNLAGALNIEYMWILSRLPYLIGSPESKALHSKVNKDI